METEGRRSVATAGRWSWKSKPAKKCVKTYPPNGSAPKIDGAGARPLNPAVAAGAGPRRVGGRPGRGDARAWARAERPEVRILVVVATRLRREP